MPLSGGGLTTSPGAVTHKLEADFSGTAFGSAATWTDITSWWMSSGTDPGGQSVTIPWGRQDQSSTVESSTTSFVLNNADGRFTPGKASSPYYPNVKRHVRMRHTITDGTTTLTMFDGYVDSWAVTPQTEGPTTSTAALTDTFGRVTASTTLRSMVVEETLLDAPSTFYPLDEAEGATSAGDLKGGSSAVVTNSKYGAGTLTFGSDATGLVGPTAAVLFASPDVGVATGAARATYLALPNALPTGGGWTIEMWFKAPTAAPAGAALNLLTVPFSALSAGLSYGLVEFGIRNVDGKLRAAVTGAAVTLAAVSSATVCDGAWHQTALTFSADGKAVTVWLDGASVGTATNASDIGWVNSKQSISVGASVVPGSVASVFSGEIALVSLYPSVISGARLLAHYNAGITALAGESTSARWARLRTYRPNTGGTTTATVGSVGSGDITGMSLGDALTDTATAEGGVVQSNRGSLDLIGRGNWYNPATTLTLNAANGEVDLPTTWRDDTQGLLNDITVERPNGAAQRAVNATSVTADGVAQTSITANVNSDRDAADMAGWLVAVGVREQIGSPTLTVNLYARASAVLTMAVCALKTYDVVTLTNLPASAPATTMSFQVQGGTATVGADTFTVELYTTTMPPTVLQLDNPATGLDDPAVVLAW